MADHEDFQHDLEEKVNVEDLILSQISDTNNHGDKEPFSEMKEEMTQNFDKSAKNEFTFCKTKTEQTEAPSSTELFAFAKSLKHTCSRKKPDCKAKQSTIDVALPDYKNTLKYSEKKDKNRETFVYDASNSLKSEDIAAPDASADEGKKPYKCTICDKRFPKKSNITAHISLMHQGKRSYNYKCTDCNINCISPSALNLHLASVHEGKKPHKCIICNTGFSR